MKVNSLAKQRIEEKDEQKKLPKLEVRIGLECCSPHARPRYIPHYTALCRAFTFCADVLCSHVCVEMNAIRRSQRGERDEAFIQYDRRAAPDRHVPEALNPLTTSIFMPNSQFIPRVIQLYVSSNISICLLGILLLVSENK